MVTQSKLNNNTRAINFSLSVDQSDNQKISHQPINQCQSINQSINSSQRTHIIITFLLVTWKVDFSRIATDSGTTTSASKPWNLKPSSFKFQLLMKRHFVSGESDKDWHQHPCWLLIFDVCFSCFFKEWLAIIQDKKSKRVCLRF